MRTLSFLPILKHNLQSSGDDWQKRESTTTMVKSIDYYDLVEEYQRDQNSYVDDSSMLDNLPKEIQEELYTNGGMICWSELADTTTWEAVETVIVFDGNENQIYLEQKEIQK